MLDEINLHLHCSVFDTEAENALVPAILATRGDEVVLEVCSTWAILIVCASMDHAFELQSTILNT